MANITNKDLEQRVIDTRDDHIPVKFRPTRALLPMAPVPPAGTVAPYVPPPTPSKGMDPSGKGGIPKALISLLATQTPVKQQSYTNSNVTINFTSDPSDTNFSGVDVWFEGYHGNPNPQLMSSGNTSPINFVCDSTGESVSVFAQTVSSTGMSAPLVFAAHTVVTLSGQVNAPPPPTIVQTLVATPTGYQFSFNFITGLLTDVISVYRIYRNTTNTFTGATVIATVPQNTNGSTSTYVFQDNIGSQNLGTLYYFVSAVNTSGLESALTAAQAGAVAQTGWLIPPQYTSSTVTVPNSNFEASTALPIPGWVPNSATLGYYTAAPYSGNQSLQVNASLQYGAAVTPQQWACNPGDQFFITAAMKSDGTSQPVFSVIFANAAGGYVGSVSAVHGTGASWAISTATGTAPALTVSMYLDCNNAAASGAGVAYFDVLTCDKLVPLDTNVSDGTAYLRSPQYLGTNSLCENGNFEASPNLPPPGWRATANATLSYETSSPQSGARSLIVNASAQYGAAAAVRLYSAKFGDAFRVTGYIFQASNVLPVIGLQFLDGTGAQLTNIAATTAATGAWTFVSATGVAPANTVSASLFCDVSGVSGGIAKFDNVTCTRQATSFELTPTSTSGTPTATTGLCTQVGITKQINIAASTWQFGDGQIGYNSGSVTPAAFGLWFIYADDPAYAGGAVTYVATATPSDCNAANGRLVFGNITTVGGGGAVSTGGGSGGGGPRGKAQL